jgi:predicted nuclease of predicted toxin-antitoxin system
MRFLIDANLPRSAVGLLVGFGHEVDFARDIGLASAPDEQIAIRAQETSAMRDMDFADIRRYPPSQYAGIVVLRLPDDAVAQEIVRVIERFIKEHQFLDALNGRLAIVETDRVRFRPPLK